VDAEAEAESVEEGADADFGGGVFAANAAHVPGTALFCEAVAHWVSLPQPIRAR